MNLLDLQHRHENHQIPFMRGISIKCKRVVKSEVDWRQIFMQEQRITVHETIRDLVCSIQDWCEVGQYKSKDILTCGWRREDRQMIVSGTASVPDMSHPGNRTFHTDAHTGHCNIEFYLRLRCGLSIKNQQSFHCIAPQSPQI